MKDTTLSLSLHLPNEALLFDLDALYACLQTIPDHRDRRGVRYPLASLLMIGVLAQMNVEHKGREITFAPTLLSQIDLRGVVVSGDAMFDRRSLSSKIVQAHGDYLWTVKENEKGFYQDIEVLFQPHRKRAGTSAPPNDFRYAQTVEKGHGRI